MTDFVNEINKRLSEVEAKKDRRDALKGFYLTASAICVFILLLSLVENIGYLSSTVRGILFYLSILAIIIALVTFVALPLLKGYFLFNKPDYFKTAAEVGSKYSDIKDDLLNSLQLVSENESNVSHELINAAFERVYKKSKSYNFKDVVDYSSTQKHLRNTSVIFGAVLLMFVFVPGLGSSVNRIIRYNTNFTPPPKFVFEITPGNSEITKGDKVKIIVKTIGTKPEQIFLAIKSSEQTEYDSKALSADSSGNFIFENDAVKSSFSYYATEAGINSEVYEISVINRPIITNYDITITSPAYSKLPDVFQRDNGNITTLPGSKVKINLNTSRELSQAKIVFSDSTLKGMPVNGISASTDFNVSKEINYKMDITDTDGIKNVNPITYSIKLLTDDTPTIEMVQPNKNINLANETKISLVSKIADDYGFSKMLLNYKLTASKYRPLPEQYSQAQITINKDVKEDEIYYTWDLSPLVLAEGEVLSYYLEIYDNDNVNGPKSAKTEVFTIQVPSMDELFAGAENTQKNATSDLDEAAKSAEQLQQEIQKISDDLKQNNREISWQEKERIESAVEKYKDLTSKVDDISQKLADMKKDLAQNNLLSEETLEKYNELQKLMDEMTNNEMKEALKKLQDALKNMTRDNVQMSLEEMKANEQNFKSSLERTINLLKRIQVEQKIDELVKRTEEMTNKLNELKEKTDKANLSDKQKQNELSQKQKDVSDEMKNIDNEMKKLIDKMSDMQDMPREQLEKAQQEFEKQQNEKLSDEAIKDLQEMQKMQAMQNQQQLSQNMQNMNKQFQDMKSAMEQMNQVKTYYQMMKNMEDLISLSKTQEKLKDKTNESANDPQVIDKNARDQSELQSNLGKVLQNLSGLSQKTFAITPEMGKSLGNAFAQMQQAINSMQNSNGSLASSFQKNAMQHLNEAASMLKQNMNQMMNGGQGGGMMSMLQQMQQLSQQQMNLNQLTQMLNQGKITPEMAAQMQRLSQQQEMIRKSLQQMNEEAKASGQSKRLAANLQKILDDMKEVVTNLQTQKVNDDLIKTQEKILSRMLDAQLSVNERDYEKERQSNSGQNVVRNSPPELILSTEEGRNKLKDELLKAIREGYNKDYEDLIRNYFEALETVKQQDNER